MNQRKVHGAEPASGPGEGVGGGVGKGAGGQHLPSEAQRSVFRVGFNKMDGFSGSGVGAGQYAVGRMES